MPCVVLASVVFVSGVTSTHAQGGPPAFPVTVAPPLSEHIKTWDEYPGRFEAFQRVELKPRVSGYVDQVNFKEGSDVKFGDLLFTLDKRPFEIAVEAAKAEVARAHAQVEFAKADLERAAPLVESKALSEQGFAVSITEHPLDKPLRSNPLGGHGSVESGPDAGYRPVLDSIGFQLDVMSNFPKKHSIPDRETKTLQLINER